MSDDSKFTSANGTSDRSLIVESAEGDCCCCCPIPMYTDGGVKERDNDIRSLCQIFKKTLLKIFEIILLFFHGIMPVRIYFVRDIYRVLKYIILVSNPQMYKSLSNKNINKSNFN